MQQPDFILRWYSIFDDKTLGDIDYWMKMVQILIFH